MSDVRDALASGQKIEAIKLYREATGCGLREAKEAVERMEQGTPPRQQGEGFKPRVKSQGCFGIVAALIVAIIAGVVYFLCAMC